MATYFDKAFDLASADIQYDVVHPWWDVVSTMTIQFTMIIAVTSISLDVFSQFGSGIRCTPKNAEIILGRVQVIVFFCLFSVFCFLFSVFCFFSSFACQNLFRFVCLCHLT